MSAGLNSRKIRRLVRISMPPQKGLPAGKIKRLLRNRPRLPAFTWMEHFNDMNHDHRPDSDRDDDLDALLASRPVRPRADFTEKTLARIALDTRDADPALDALLD